jgi:hypothetical protein
VTLIALGSGVAVAQTAPALAVAQSTPAPVSSPTTDRSGAPSAPATSPVASGFDPFGVKGLTISGTLRAYDFNRINTPEYNPKTGAATGPNRQAFNFGGVIRADYKIGDSPFSVGGAFWGADPFGLDGGPVGCNVYAGKGTGKLIVNEYQALCAKNNAGIDNSLPGYALETFEYYVKYHDKYATASVGNQLLNKAWFPSSDSRIKPALYQSADATFNLGQYISVGGTVVTRFEDRTESQFDDCNLLSCTGPYTPAGVGGGYTTKTPFTPGADRFALVIKPNSHLSVTGEYYTFLNLANLTYAESKYSLAPKNPLNPYIAGQFVGESQAGKAVVGKIDDQTTGVQFGINPVKNLLFTVGADYSPWNYATVCASSASAAATGYFLPGGGTGTALTAASGTTNPEVATGPCTLSSGKAGTDYRFAYGGIASPYSDSYASDPLYTTSISQGMVDRRSAGAAFKAAFTYTSTNKRLVAIASEAAYTYDTQYVRNRTYELDADITYNFNPVRPRSYKGFSVRERFADRTQPTLPFNFKYVRHQLQYSF